MIGDAAGFVDPITGEGLYYAFRSAELLAEALIADRPEQYQEEVFADFLPDLQTAAGIADRFFFGKFLGGGFIERMVQFAESSRVVRALMCDLIAGSQSYIGLKRRMYLNLLPFLAESFGTVSSRFFSVYWKGAPILCPLSQFASAPPSKYGYDSHWIPPGPNN